MECGTDSEENRDYVVAREVACRLAGLLGECLAREECVGLVGVLQFHHLQCGDGFWLNGYADGWDDMMLGRRQASAIASCLTAEPSSSAQELLDEYEDQSMSPRIQVVVASLVDRMLASPGMREVDPPDLRGGSSKGRGRKRGHSPM